MMMTHVLPRVTTLSLSGIRLVDAVNNADPTDGRVPSRTNGRVAELLAKYPELHLKWQKIRVAAFHRYAGVGQVECFESVAAAEAALPHIELALRKNPGPGINLPFPVTTARTSGVIVIDGIYPLGHVDSSWDEESRSVINETREDHEYRTGFVVRQLAVVSHSIYVTTFGEGINDYSDRFVGVNQERAWNNGTNVLHGFMLINIALFDLCKTQPGFLVRSNECASGANSYYTHEAIINFPGVLGRHLNPISPAY